MAETFTIDLLDNLKMLRHLLNFKNINHVRNFLNNIIKQVEKVKEKQEIISPAILRISEKNSVIIKIAESIRELDTIEEVYELLQEKFKKYNRKMEVLAKRREK